MDQASQALVRRDYFAAERLAHSALRKAHAARDYERMARIVLPLQEARRQKRDIAFDAAQRGSIYLIDADVPTGKKLVEGCYLVAPPRVGADGRMMRESADRREVPAIITVREPTTRDGRWPLVALGPVTVRAKVDPPRPPKASAAKASVGKAKSKAGAPARGVQASSKKKGSPVSASEPPPAESLSVDKPSPEWFLSANEALGDAAIASVADNLTPHARVDVLMELLETTPDHEKLHQRLAEAAREAARTPLKTPSVRRPVVPFDADAPDEDM